MRIQCRMPVFNEGKLTDEDVAELKSWIKRRLIGQLSYELETLIFDGIIKFDYDCLERNGIVGSLELDIRLHVPERDNDLRLETNKANGRQLLVICDKGERDEMERIYSIYERKEGIGYGR